MIFAENAIVEQTSDTDVKWYARCPYCGHVNEYIKYRTVVNRNTRKSMVNTDAKDAIKISKFILSTNKI